MFIASLVFVVVLSRIHSDEGDKSAKLITVQLQHGNVYTRQLLFVKMDWKKKLYNSIWYGPCGPV